MFNGIKFFATNLNNKIPITLQFDGVNLWLFKLRLFARTEFIVWIIKGCKDNFIRNLNFVAKSEFVSKERTSAPVV